MLPELPAPRERTLSGMRPTGLLHLGHYFLLQKWVAMQQRYDCFFFIADFHALTTATSGDEDIGQHTIDIVAGWLAAGIDPDQSVLFVQSQVPEHAELHVLLSMICPLPWLLRIPHYKDVAAKASEDTVTYGFLGYPVLQAADIIIHQAGHVPVGEDQAAHVEIAARLARAFNDRFGKDDGWQAKAQQLAGRLKDSEQFAVLRKRYTRSGDVGARDEARAMVRSAGFEREDVQRLLGWIEGGGRQLLVPPQTIMSSTPRLPGLDGAKMSKSARNDIGMFEEKSAFAAKLKTMPTDPARVQRSDPGDPNKCPVWDYHKLFTGSQQRDELYAGCTKASIGCVDCKSALEDNLENTIAPLREKGRQLLTKPDKIRQIIAAGNERARASASETLATARAAVGLAEA